MCHLLVSRGRRDGLGRGVHEDVQWVQVKDEEEEGEGEEHVCEQRQRLEGLEEESQGHEEVLA